MARRKMDWFERKARRYVKNNWFVSVAAPKQVHGQISARQTETFPTETEAKQFAKEMLSMSGHKPARRIISGSHLIRWIEEAEGQCSEA